MSDFSRIYKFFIALLVLPAFTSALSLPSIYVRETVALNNGLLEPSTNFASPDTAVVDLVGAEKPNALKAGAPGGTGGLGGLLDVGGLVGGLTGGAGGLLDIGGLLGGLTGRSPTDGSIGV